MSGHPKVRIKSQIRRMPMQNLFRTKKFYIIALLVITLSNVLFYTGFKYPFNWDEGIPAMSPYQFGLGFFVWNPQIASGFLNPVQPLIHNLFYAVYVAFYTVFGLIASSTFALWLQFAITAVAVFLIITELVEESYKKEAVYASAFLAAVIASMHFYSHLGTYSATLPALSVAFLCLVIYTKRARNKVDYVPGVALLGLGLAYLLAIGYTGTSVQNAMFFAIIILVFLRYTLKEKFAKRYYAGILVAVLIAVVINLSGIYSTMLLLSRASSQYFNAASVSEFSTASLQPVRAILAFGPQSYEFFSPLELLVLISVFSIALYGLVHFGRERRSNDSQVSVTAVALTVSLAIFILIIIGVNGPYGQIFNSLFYVIPYLEVLRIPYAALHYIVLFIVSVGFGLGSIIITEKALTRGAKRAYALIATVILVLTAASYIYAFSYASATMNINQYGIGLINNTVSMPGYVVDAANFVNAQNGSFTTVTLPVSKDEQMTTWYTGMNVYEVLLDHPVYSGYENVFFSPPSLSMYFENVGVPAGDSNMSELSHALGIFGIKYVIVQGDALDYAIDISNASYRKLCLYCYVPFNFSTIYRNLNASGFRLLKRFNSTTVYENPVYDQMVFAANARRVENANESKLFDLIENKSFNITNTVIVSGNVSTPAPISNFSRPSINYTIRDPTDVQVGVRGASAPFYLVFVETYDAGWSASFSNGSTAGKHVEVNGFANAWLVNKTGNYTITIRYDGQGVVWFAMFIGSLVLLLCMILLIKPARSKLGALLKRPRVQKKRVLVKNSHADAMRNKRLDRYASCVLYVAIALYCILFALFIVVAAAFNTYQLMQYSLLAFVAIGFLLGVSDSGPLFLFILSVGFVSISAIWFFPHMYGALGENLGSIGYYSIASFAIAMLTSLFTRGWRARVPAKRAVHPSGTKRLAFGMLLLVVAIILLVGPFWPNMRYHHVVVYIPVVHIGTTTRSLNFTVSMSPQPYYAVEPFCAGESGLNVSLNFTASRPASVFILNRSMNLNYYYNKTYPDYESILSGASVYSMENATHGSLGGPIEGGCFNVTVLSDAYNKVHIRIRESFISAKHTYMHFNTTTEFPGVSNLTFGPAIYAIGAARDAMEFYGNKSS